MAEDEIIEEIEPEIDETETLEELNNKDESLEELEKLREYAKKVDELIKNNPRLINRVENKHDFASEVINAKSNQKIANLTEKEISLLLDKRAFMNFLYSYGWKVLSELVSLNVMDIENYSLSKNGFLIERTLVENLRQSSAVVQVDKKNMKGGEGLYNV
ncbi:MAG: hypothetical protein NC935_02245 [Candidatus Omnitrophica bacterium]|nr:hypothetical protein [Candidatus Omnitrophota bacterium]